MGGEPAATESVELGARRARAADVVAVARRRASVHLAPVALDRIRAARAVVEEALAAGTAAYGLNRHLGSGRDTPMTDVRAQQNRIIDNHLGGIGAPLPEEEVRAIIAARLVGFAHGASGVRAELAAEYTRLLNDRVPIRVPSIGSVGASDLVQLAAVAAVARSAVPFEAQEALAALSANAYSVGVGALVGADLTAIASVADLSAAVSLEALGAVGLGGSVSPLDARLHAGRAAHGQPFSAARIRAALEGSDLVRPRGEDDPRPLQDAISFRSVPQIHGALLVAIEQLIAAVETELAHPADNPFVDVASRSLVSGGNFDAVGLALAFESVRVALAAVANAAERRISILTAAGATRRRAGENRAPGLLSYSAAALVASIRAEAAPVTLSVTTLSEGVEDHASFAPSALQAVQRSITALRQLLAIELLVAVDTVTGAAARPGVAHRLGAGTEPFVVALDDILAEHHDGGDQVDRVVQLLRLAA